jgi:hypothetical protein
MSSRPRRLIVVGAVWLFLVFGCWFFALTRPGISVRWQKESTPPERISLLKAGGNGEILAETPDGQVYEFIYGLHPAWERTVAPFEDAESDANCDVGDSAGYLIPSPPGQIKSRASQNCVAVENGYHLELILLENGEIWSWSYERNADTGLLLVVALGLSFLLAVSLVLLGLVAATFQKVK